MKNVSKILIIFILFILLLIPTIESFGIDMNLTPNILENNTFDDTTNSIVSNTTDNTSVTNNPRTVTVTSSDNDEFLTVENILSVILIVIGILLIFLGIAIIVRFKWKSSTNI